MLPLLAGVVVALHGLIHLIGFVTAWRIVEVTGFPYRTTALDGVIGLGSTGTRVVGIAWLVVALGFVVAGVGLWRGSTWAPALTGVLAGASIVVCALGLPEAAAGIVVDVVILAVITWVVLRHGSTVPTT